MPQIHLAQNDGVWLQTSHAPPETVLESLLKIDPTLSYSCRAGSCQSCMMKIIEGEVPPKSQVGLKDAWKSQNFFLPCIAHATSDLRIVSPASAGLELQTRILEIEPLSQTIFRIRLSVPKNFTYLPGQFLTLKKPDGTSRSYSLASLPSDPFLELHVRRYPQGALSAWLCDSQNRGATLSLRGPVGGCTYLPNFPQESLILAGTGTGLAPLLGIIRDALTHAHPAPIHLYHAAPTHDGLYLVDELLALETQHPEFHYHRVLESSDQPDNHHRGRIDEVLLRSSHDWKQCRFYLCGAPEMVRTMRRQLYLAGADLGKIHADAFLPTSPLPLKA